MLDLKEDRKTYKELLKTSDEYEVDSILTTSYSLDMEALIAICIILGLDEEVFEESLSNKAEDKNKIPMLEAIGRLSKKIVVVCQNGKIKAPTNKTSKIYALLEDMVYTVIPSNQKSFHSKVWIIKYKNKQNSKDIKYKLIVSSKNLTFDRSWDVQINMDGYYNKNIKAQNDNLIDFVKSLQDVVDSEHNSNFNKIINKILKDLPHIEFDTCINEKINVDKCEFLYLPKDKIEFVENNESKLKKALIFSPFITDSIISNVLNKARLILVTRESELYKLNDIKHKERLQVFVINKRIRLGESNNSEDDGVFAQEEDIHAKMFLFNDGINTYFYIGSANSTESAFKGNTEAMIKLTISDENNRFFNNIKQSLFGNEEVGGNVYPYFVPVQIDEDIIDIKTQEEKDLDNIIRKFFSIKARAEAESNGKKHKITVFFKGYEKNEQYKITIKPLLSKQTLEVKEKLVFENLKLNELSEFYVITFYDRNSKKENTSQIIKISTEGIPSLEERIVAISSNMLNSVEDFLEMLSYILAENYYSIRLDEEYNLQTDDQSMNIEEFTPAIYERMLKIAANNPERLINEVDFLMKISNKRPKGFEELYDKFKEVLNNIGKK